MQPLELIGSASAHREANWSGASSYYRYAQQTAYDRIARSRKLSPEEKRQWTMRIAVAFAEIQQVFSSQKVDTYTMKNAMLTACHYASPGRKAMPLEDVEANLQHLVILLKGRVYVPHPSAHPAAVDDSRRYAAERGDSTS